MASSALTSLALGRPRGVLAAFALVALVASLGLSRLRQEEDLLVFLPTTDPDVRLFQDVSRRFGALRVALVGVEVGEGQDVFSAEVVAGLQAATQAIRNVRGVDRVVSLATVTDVVGGALGAEVRPLVPGPPPDAAARAALRRRVLGRSHVVGNVVSADGRAALIMVFLADGKAERVEERVRAAAERHLPGLRLYFGGAPFASRAIYAEAQADVRRLSPLALAVLLLVVVLSFRDPVGVAVTIGAVGFSVLVVLGAMGLCGERFTVATSALPVILFASGSSYAVHVLGRYYLVRQAHPEISPREAIREAVAIVGAPLAIAAGTTSVGFFSFVATDVRPMRAFGIACGAGVLLCWLTALLAVPALVALWPRRARAAPELRLVGELLVRVWSFGARHRRLVSGAALLLGLGLVPSMSRVAVRMEPRAFFRVGSDPWLTERFLDERFGGASFVQVALRGDLDDPATLRELARLEDHARSLPGVTQVSSVLEPLSLVNEAMSEARRLPVNRAQAANLYFFLQGEAGVSSLLSEDRKEALMHVRVRGDARPVMVALEGFVASALRGHPGTPTVDDVVDRLAWLARSETRSQDPGPGSMRTRIDRAARILALPGAEDGAWIARRTEVARAFLTGVEAPPIEEAVRARLIQSVQLGVAGAELKEAFRRAAPSPDEGELAADGLGDRLVQARRELGVARATPILLAAAGLPAEDRRLAARIRPVVEDLFLEARLAPAVSPISARVAGEPILDRGFSRAVERNQVLSLAISVAVVFALLVVLFRSLSQALICLSPSLLTLVVLFGGMGMAGIHIDLGTSLVAGIATGAGSDFAMHYLWYLRARSAEEVSRSVGPVMLVSILLVSLGFGVLALGRSPVMNLFGALAGASMALSAVLTCLLLPALLNRVGAVMKPGETTVSSGGSMKEGPG